MSLKYIAPCQVQTMTSLYGDSTFDISSYRVVPFSTSQEAMKELKMYRVDAELIVTYPREETKPQFIEVTTVPHVTDTYAVFSICSCTAVIKDFALSGHLENVIEILVTTGNTVIYSTKDVDVPFFSSWFPLYLALLTSLKVYVRVKQECDLLLSSTRGFLPSLTMDKFRPEPVREIVTSKSTEEYEALLVPMANLMFGLSGSSIRLTGGDKKPVIPAVKGVKGGLLIKPYSCILQEGTNIMGCSAVRPGFIMASRFTDHNTPRGTITVKGPHADLKQFGDAHKNIWVTTNFPCKVDLSIDGSVYLSTSIPVGTTLLHAVPIIHGTYSTYFVDISNPTEPDVKDLAPEILITSIQWDALDLMENPNNVKEEIITPEFDLVCRDGIMKRRFPPKPELCSFFKNFPMGL